MNFKQRLIINLGIDFLVIAAVSAGIILIGADISKNSQRAAGARTQIDSRNKNTEILAAMRKDYDEAKLYEKDLEKALLSRDELINFVPDIGSIAQRNKINATVSLGTEFSGAESKLRSTNFTISASGEYPALITFLREINQSHYKIKITTLELVDQGNKLFRLNLNGQILSL